MLTDEQIKIALHADRVVPLGAGNFHGPLGLEQLSATVRTIRESGERVQRPVTLSIETWSKLDELARKIQGTMPTPISASEMAAAIIERAIRTAG